MFTKAGVIAQTHIAGVYTPTDSDAIAFLTATGITDNTIVQAIDELVIAAKANSWWTLCAAIYPMVGGTGDTHKYNLKDPQDTDAAFRIAFNGSWTHSATGALPDGSSAYGDTKLSPSAVLTTDDSHISYYSRTDFDDGSNNYEIGSISGGSTGMSLHIRISNGVGFTAYFTFGTDKLSATNTDGKGFYIGTRTSNTSADIYKNGSSVVNSTTARASGGLNSENIYIGTLNNAGNPNGLFGNMECAFATIGDGISSSVAADMYTDIQTFQTTLGRQV